MNFTLIPSLKQIAFSNVAVSLWSRGNIRNLASQILFTTEFCVTELREREWRKLEPEVIKNAHLLQIPESLKEELETFVRGVGWEILLWFELHECIYTYSSKLPEKFSWTPQGTIDKRKTAEGLIQDESLHATKRFRLACIYCLEQYISPLNQIMIDKSYVWTDTGDISWEVPPLVSLWSAYLDGRVPLSWNLVCSFGTHDFMHASEYGFQIAVQSGNVAAIKFFFEKLPEEGKEKILVKAAKDVANNQLSHSFNFPQEHNAGVLCFLLSVMSEKQQMEVLQSCLFEVLGILLNWPWQEHFIKLVQHVQSAFSHDDYYRLLHLIIFKAKDGYRDLDYKELFKKYWQDISLTNKMFFIDQSIEQFLFFNMFECEDHEIAALVLQDASAAQKEDIIFCRRGMNICLKLIYHGDWDKLRFLILECFRDMEDARKKMKKLRKIFWFYYSQSCDKVFFKDMKTIWIDFFHLLEDQIQDDDKVSSKDEQDKLIGNNDIVPLHASFNSTLQHFMRNSYSF